MTSRLGGELNCLSFLGGLSPFLLPPPPPPPLSAPPPPSLSPMA